MSKVSDAIYGNIDVSKLFDTFRYIEEIRYIGKSDIFFSMYRNIGNFDTSIYRNVRYDNQHWWGGSGRGWGKKGGGRGRGVVGVGTGTRVCARHMRVISTTPRKQPPRKQVPRATFTSTYPYSTLDVNMRTTWSSYQRLNCP